MPPLSIPSNPNNTVAMPGLWFRSSTLTLLIVFCVSVLFSFTLVMPLRPTPVKAFFGSEIIAALMIIAFHRAWDFLKALAESFALHFMIRLAMNLLQKLEQTYLIKNLLQYPDALVAVQYLGEALDKEIRKPKTPAQVKDKPVDVDITAIINGGLGLPAAAMSPQQLETMGKKKLLTAAQEQQLVIGAVAMLTSPGACVGRDPRLIQNVAVYLAARNAGLALTDADPASGTNFYQQMAKLADPYSSPAFMQIALQDTASKVESEAKTAADLEVLSPGQKNGRDLNGNNVAASMQSVNARIQALLIKSLNADNLLATTNFASKLGSVLGDFVAQIVLTDLRIIPETGACGTPGVGSVTPPILPPGNGSVNVTLSVNGSPSASVVSGQTATLSWNVVQPTGTVTITNLPANCGTPGLSGNCTIAPQNDTTYVLSVNGQALAQASVTIVTAFIQSESFTATPQVVAPGGTSVLSWSVSGNQLSVSLDGATVGLSGSQSELLTTQSRTFTLSISDSQTGQILDQLSVTVGVNFGLGAASISSQPFKVRE